MTRYPRDLTADVIVPPDGDLKPVSSIGAWYRLKEAQRLEDGSSARITWARRDRLLDMPCLLPGAAVALDMAEADIVLERARPTIAAACARRLAALRSPAGQFPVGRPALPAVSPCDAPAGQRPSGSEGLA